MKIRHSFYEQLKTEKVCTLFQFLAGRLVISNISLFKNLSYFILYNSNFFQNKKKSQKKFPNS